MGEPPGPEKRNGAPVAAGSAAQKEAAQLRADIYATPPAASSLDDFDTLLLPVNNRAVATDLAARGLAVFPIRDWGDGDGWKPVAGFLDKATSDRERISEWWTRWPDSRVGLLTGERNGVTVLDLDTKNGKDGVAALEGLGFPDLAALSPVRVKTPTAHHRLLLRRERRLRAVGRPGLREGRP